MFNGPKQLKYSKVKKGKLKKLNFRSNDLQFGAVGLKAVESGILNFKQIEAARQAMSRKIKKTGKIWIRVFPNLPITSKSRGARMGKGKGRFSHWGVKIFAGQILFEICCIDHDISYIAFKTGGAKLPIKTKIVNY